MSESLDNTTLNDGDTVTINGGHKLYGEHFAKSCPFCEKFTDEIGHLDNPFVIVSGEKICDDCKDTLKLMMRQHRSIF